MALLWYDQVNHNYDKSINLIFLVSLGETNLTISVKLIIPPMTQYENQVKREGNQERNHYFFANKSFV